MNRFSAQTVGAFNVVAASAAMTATLPGRTYGLGLIASPLMREFGISELQFGAMNFAASILGAMFALPTGFMIDRFGVRRTNVLILIALAASTFFMGVSSGMLTLMVSLILVRGFGQSALSVASMSIISKWFHERIGLAMGVFAVLLTFGFIGSVLAVGGLVEAIGWRPAWNFLALAIVSIIPILVLAVRERPREQAAVSFYTSIDRESFNALLPILKLPSFWAIALGSAFFNLVFSSITLLNEAILEEMGFLASDAVKLMAVLTGVGLVSNLITGSFISRRNLGTFLGAALLVQAVALFLFPGIKTATSLFVYGGAMGFVGGQITVVFFTAWRTVFGREHVGGVQGVAQVLTVLASALGPVLVAGVHALSKSHLPIFAGFAVVSMLLAFWAFLIRVPVLKPLDREHRLS